jgi:hypothetical protein
VPEVGKGYVPINPDFSGFNRELRTGVERGSRNVKAEIEAVIDATGLRRHLEAAAKNAGRGVEAEVEVHADTTGLRAEVDRATDAIEEEEEIRVKVKADTAGLEGFSRVAGVVRSFNIGGGGSFGRLAFPAIAIGAQVAATALEAASAAAIGLTSSLGTMVGVAATVPGALSAVAQGAGTIALAAFGLDDAFKATESVNKGAAGAAATAARQAQTFARAQIAAAESVADSQRSLARTIEASSQTIADAQERVIEAQENVADVAVRSNERAADAQRAFQRAVENSADRVSSSLQRIGDAERRVADAQRASVDAQRALNEARQTAARNLEDLQERVSDGALEEERALLELEQARERLANWDIGGASSFGDLLDAMRRGEDVMGGDIFGLEEADLAVREAEERLDDIQRRRRRDAEEFAEAQRRGIEGSREVEAAQRRVEDAARAAADAQSDLEERRVEAAEAQRDALEDVADAQRNLDRTMQDIERDRRDASEQLTDAVEAAGRAQVSATRQVEDAQRAVERAIRDAQWAAEELGTAGTAAVNNLQYALDKLSPAGRAFVDLVNNELKPRFYELRDIAQQEILPKLGDALRRIAIEDFPIIREAVRSTSQVIGDFTTKVADMVTSPEWKRDLADLAQRNAGYLEQFGDVALNLSEALKDIMIAAAPLTDWLVDTIEDWSQIIEDWADAARESGQLEGFFRKTRETLEKVFELLGNVFTIVKNIAIAAEPLGQLLLDDMIAFTEKWAEWTGSVEGKNALKQYFDDAYPVIREIAGLAGDIFKLFFGQADGEQTTDLIRQIRTELIPALDEMLDKIGTALGPAFIELLTNFTRLIGELGKEGGAFTVFVTVFGDFLRVATAALENIPLLNDLVGWMLAVAAAVKAINLAGTLTGFTSFIGVMAGTKGGKAGEALRGIASGLFGIKAAGTGASVAGAVGGAGGAAGAGAGAAGAATAGGPFFAIAAGIAAIGAAGAAAYIHIPPVRKAVNEAGEEMLTKGIPAFQEYRDTLLKGSARLKTEFDKHPGIGETVTKTWENVKTNTGTIWDAIFENAQRWTGAIGSLLQTSFGTWQRIWEGGLQAMSGFFDIWIGIFTLDWERAWGGIRDFFGGVWDAIYAAMSGAVELMIRLFTEFPRRALEALGDLTGTLIGKGLELLGSLNTGILQKWAEIATWFNNLGETILTAIPSLANVLVEKGKELIGGLGAGITEGFKSIGGIISTGWNAAFGNGDGDGGTAKINTQMFAGQGYGRLPFEGATGQGGYGESGGPVRVTGRHAGANSVSRKIVEMAKHVGLPITAGSIYRPGARTSSGSISRHAASRAVDFSGTAAQMAAFNRAMFARFGQQIHELIYTPGINTYNGNFHRYSNKVRADHYDHVHVSLYKGGLLNQASRALVGERGPEILDLPAGSRVTPLDHPSLQNGNVLVWHQEAPIFGVDDLKGTIQAALAERDNETRRLTMMGSRGSR